MLFFVLARSLAGQAKAAQSTATRLTWVHARGRGELEPRYGNFCKKGCRRLRLDLSVYQAAILLLFNQPPQPAGGAGEAQAQTLTLLEMAERLGVEVGALSKHVASLSCGKYKALRKGNPKQRRSVAPDGKRQGAACAWLGLSGSVCVVCAWPGITLVDRRRATVGRQRVT